MTKERGEELAIEYGIKFMETSAKASINVEEAFYTLARDIKAKMEKKLVSQSISGGHQKFCLSKLSLYIQKNVQIQFYLSTILSPSKCICPSENVAGK